MAEREANKTTASEEGQTIPWEVLVGEHPAAVCPVF